MQAHCCRHHARAIHATTVGTAQIVQIATRVHVSVALVTAIARLTLMSAGRNLVCMEQCARSQPQCQASGLMRMCATAAWDSRETIVRRTSITVPLYRQTARLLPHVAAVHVSTVARASRETALTVRALSSGLACVHLAGATKSVRTILTSVHRFRV